MTSFDILLDALDLQKNGRKNAAKSQWNSLDEDFRRRIKYFTLLVNETPQEELAACSGLVIASKFGEFTLTQSVLEDLVSFVPELI